MGARRLFIALNLPSKVRQVLKDVQDRLRLKNGGVDIKWVKPEIIHLTLHFLGWVEEGGIDRVKEIMAQTTKGNSPLEVELGQLGCFPDARRGRVVWVELKERSWGLKTLQARLRDALASAGFEVDTRAWQAHLTLGRLRAPQPVRALDAPVRKMRFTVDQVDLMESILHPKGPEYKILASALLRAF